MSVYRIEGSTLYKFAGIAKALHSIDSQKDGFRLHFDPNMRGFVFSAHDSEPGYSSAMRHGYCPATFVRDEGDHRHELDPVELLNVARKVRRGDVTITTGHDSVTFAANGVEYRIATKEATDALYPVRTALFHYATGESKWSMSGAARGWKRFVKAVGPFAHADYRRPLLTKFNIEVDGGWNVQATDVYKALDASFADGGPFDITSEGRGDVLIDARMLKSMLAKLSADDRLRVYGNAAGTWFGVNDAMLVYEDRTSNNYPYIRKLFDDAGNTRGSMVVDVDELAGIVGMMQTKAESRVALHMVPGVGACVFSDCTSPVRVGSARVEGRDAITIVFDRKKLADTLEAVALASDAGERHITVGWSKRLKPVSFVPVPKSAEGEWGHMTALLAPCRSDLLNMSPDIEALPSVGAEPSETEPETVDAVAVPVESAEPETVAAAETVAETAEPVEPATVEAEPVAEGEAAAVAESEAEAVAVDAAPVAETPVVEPEPETVEIPEVPPQTDDKARVVKVSPDVMPVGVSAREFEGFSGFAHKARGFKNEAGRRIVYVAFNEGRCVVAYREGYRHGMCPEADTAVAEYLKRFGWTLTA